jgi:chemotaxis protein MotB
MAAPISAARPIIVIKKKVAHGGAHGGAWKVAYADFVTAMMSLFIVLWLLNSSSQVKKAVGGYFKDPRGTSKKVGTGLNGSGENFTLTKDNMSQIKDELQKTVRQMDDFDKLKDQISMTVTTEGLRIELMESEKGTFFPSAAAEPGADGKDILIKLAQQLGQLPNTLSIEGHTDAKPFSSSGKNYSNWELSTDRANAARRMMEANGLRPNQITQVRGYADQRLRNPKDPEDASNRRISLIVQYQPKPDDDDPPKAADAKPGAKPAADTTGKDAAKPAAPAPPAKK